MRTVWSQRASIADGQLIILPDILIYKVLCKLIVISTVTNDSAFYLFHLSFFQNNLVCLCCLLRWELDSVHDFSSSSWLWRGCRPNGWFVSNSTEHWRYQALRVGIWRRPVRFWSVSLASKVFLCVLFCNKCWKFIINIDHTSFQRWVHQTSCDLFMKCTIII